MFYGDDSSPTPDRPFNPHFSPGGEMIAQIIGFTRRLLKEWNIVPTEVVPCEFKDPCLFKDSGRVRQSGEKWGLTLFCRCYPHNGPEYAQELGFSRAGNGRAHAGLFVKARPAQYSRRRYRVSRQSWITPPPEVAACGRYRHLPDCRVYM